MVTPLRGRITAPKDQSNSKDQLNYMFTVEGTCSIEYDDMEHDAQKVAGVATIVKGVVVTSESEELRGTQTVSNTVRSLLKVRLLYQ